MRGLKEQDQAWLFVLRHLVPLIHSSSAHWHEGLTPRCHNLAMDVVHVASISQ